MKDVFTVIILFTVAIWSISMYKESNRLEKVLLVSDVALCVGYIIVLIINVIFRLTY